MVPPYFHQYQQKMKRGAESALFARKYSKMSIPNPNGGL
jgi:hypothetical protein